MIRDKMCSHANDSKTCWTCELLAKGSFTALAGSADERDQRLMLAEEILSNLATGYWVAVLDDNDDPVKERMGQRILNYWRTWDSPPNAGTQRPGSPSAGHKTMSTTENDTGASVQPDGSAAICACCGLPSEKQRSVHRDGFEEGPEVWLCNACGMHELPSLPEIWCRIKTRKDAGERIDTLPLNAPAHRPARQPEG